MLFTENQSVEDVIITLLLNKEATAKGLLRYIKDTRAASYTIQALYLVLNQLVVSEVIIKQGKFYSLNEEWRARVVSKFEQEKAVIITEGESLSYTLSSLVHHDIQWKNVVLPLHAKHLRDPIFFYNFHYIWLHLGKSRENSELAYYRTFIEKNTFAFSLIGSKSTHDVEIKRKLQNEYVQWAVGMEHFSKTDYLTVFGNYIITTKVSKRIANEIEDCYRRSIDTEMLRNELQKIGIEKKKIRLIIEHNKEKAKKIRKRLSKEFFVPQELIEKFDLF